MRWSVWWASLVSPAAGGGWFPMVIPYESHAVGFHIACGHRSATAQGRHAAATRGVAEGVEKPEVPALEVYLGERGVHRDRAARGTRWVGRQREANAEGGAG